MTDLHFYQDSEKGGPSSVNFEASHTRVFENGQNEEKKTQKKEKNLGKKKERTVGFVKKGARSEGEEEKPIGKKTSKKKDPIKKKRSFPEKIGSARTKRDIRSILKNAIKKKENKGVIVSDNRPDLSLAALGLMTVFQELTKMCEV